MHRTERSNCCRRDFQLLEAVLVTVYRLASVFHTHAEEHEVLTVTAPGTDTIWLTCRAAKVPAASKLLRTEETRDSPHRAIAIGENLI